MSHPDASARQRDPREIDKPYMGWIARLPCIACFVHRGRAFLGVQVAHCRADYEQETGDRFWRPVGMQEKPHDRRTTPLCVKCHLTGRLAQHSTNEALWWEDLGVYPPEFVAALIAAYESGRSGMLVVATFAARARGIAA